MVRNEIAKEFMLAIVTGYWANPAPSLKVSRKEMAKEAFKLTDAYLNEREEQKV